MKLVLYLSLSMMICSASGRRFNKISDRLFELEKQLWYGPDDLVTDYYRISYDSMRRSLNVFEKIHISERDTVYLLEHYGDGCDRYLNMVVWNKTDTLAYARQSDMDSIKNELKHVVYQRYMYNLVTSWDCKALEEEGRNASFTPVTRAFAARIIFYKKRFSIDYFIFNYFWNENKEEDEEIYYKYGIYN